MVTETAKAIFDFDATEKGDLPFVIGDIIEVLDKNGDWWTGRSKDGKVGYFPFNRVELLKTNKKNMPANSGLLQSVKARGTDEKIKKVFVEFKDFKNGKRGNALFIVDATLEDGKKIAAEKFMTDFRRFDEALKLLDADFNYTQTLPPKWADGLPLGSSHAKARARALTKFLAGDSDGRGVFDVLMLTWLTSKKADLKKQGSSSASQIALSSSDSKDAVKSKVMKALGTAYAVKSSEGPELFENGGTPGEHLGKLARVKYDWKQRDETEVNLSKYEYILIIGEKTKYDGWWYGQKASGKKGLFPYNYVEVLKEPDVKRLFKGAKGGKGSKNSHAPTSNFDVNNTPYSKAPSVGGSPKSKLKTRYKKKTEAPFSPQPMSPLTSKTDSPVNIRPIDGGKSDNSSSMLNGNIKKKKGKTGQSSSSSGRQRLIIANYSLSSIDGFDELRSKGYTFEQNGNYVKLKKKKVLKNGDLVSLKFSAYTWNPQKQTLQEFSSSDRLEDPPSGIATGEAGRSGDNMEFVFGNNSAIDGLEEAVQYMDQNTEVRLIVAPSKGYGDAGSPPEIPGNCYLVYDLTLVDQMSQGQYKPERGAIFSVGISKGADPSKAPRARRR